MTETRVQYVKPGASSSTPMAVAHLGLALIFIASIFNYTDRYMIAILLPDMKRDFHLSDTQIGFLTGAAFTFFHVLAGVPIARLADRYSRKRLLALALALWSLMTCGCAIARNFLELVIMRVLVGVGEAGSGPPSYALLSDLYPPSRRATVSAIYLAGAPMGILIGFWLGGWIEQQYGWRSALVAVGAPGFLFAFVLLLLLPEPSRGRAAPAGSVSLRRGLLELLRRPTFRHSALGNAFYNALIVAYVNWLPSFFARSHGLGAKETGMALAFVIGPPELVGVIAGGFIVDRLARKDPRWYVRFPAVVILLATPLFMLTFTVQNTNAALACLVLPLLIGVMQTPPSFALAQSLVHPGMRALAAAVLMIIINVISSGLGPIAVGFASDLLEPVLGLQSLKYALLIATPVLGAWAAMHYLLAAKSVRADLARCAREGTLESHPAGT